MIDSEGFFFLKDFTNVTIYRDFNAHHKTLDDGTPNTNGQYSINFIDKYDYAFLNTTEPTYFSFQQGTKKFSLIDVSLASDIFHRSSVEINKRIYRQ